MSTIETVMQPFTWNYTHLRGTTFSRTLIFNADMTGAMFDLVITGANGKVKPTIKILSATAKETAVNILLTAQDTLNLAAQNKWALIVTLRSETFPCWSGQFNLRSVI